MSTGSEIAQATPVGNTAPFSRRMLYGVIAVAVASLLAALGLAVFGDELSGSEPTAGANGYSQSAIGHAALVELLEELDVPVVRSRDASAAKAQHGVLVVAEPVVPDDDPAAAKKLRDMVTAAPRVLVVLPRWWGSADPGKPAWIEDRFPVASAEIQAVLAALELDAEVEASVVATLTSEGELPAPVLPDVQTITADEVLGEVWAEHDDGPTIVLGRTWIDDDTELWLLADPGAINNVGLREPANARFAIALLDELRQGGPVVFDEVVHGFEHQPSLWRALFRFPLVLATMTALLCAVVLLWAAVGRFGPARAAPPPVPSGKDFLIRHTAALLHGAGHDAHAVRRYLATTIQSVRVALHAPRELQGEALRAWLERVRVARGGTISLLDLERDVEALPRGAHRRSRLFTKHAVELSARIHRWRLEMTHGHRHRT